MGVRTAAAVLLAVLLAACSAAPRNTRSSIEQGKGASISIVPFPRTLRAYPGSYIWHVPVSISAASAPEKREAGFVAAVLHRHGIASTVVSNAAADVRLRIDPRARDLGDEGYALEVGSAGIRLRGGGAAGLYYGIQSLEQITQFAPSQAPLTRRVSVRDRPVYRWRGIHLDVSRHFFSVPVVERYIALAAHYKLNFFHWHLTDDQAWRLQIHAYPRLARGPSYTQSDVRAVVSFAQARHVTVVPEIEMPGHNTAALAAYPGIAGTQPFELAVLREVMQLFPGRYVHIGGDEVQYTASRASFMRGIAAFLEAHHRTPVAWDDLVAAHPDPNVVLTVWHGAAAGAASAAGHDIVMSADGPLYFDAYQGDRHQEPLAPAHLSTLSLVYNYDPLPDAASATFASHLLGVQANMWTEKIDTPEHLFYMVLPRELALAEIAWDAPARKNWNRFIGSLPAQFAWLDAHAYPYRVPNVAFEVAEPSARFAPRPGNVQSALAILSVRLVHVRLRIPVANAHIYYTTDGSAPTQASRLFRGPIVLELPTRGMAIVRAAAFLPDGRRSATTECVFTYGNARAPYRSRSWSGLVSP